MAKAILDIDVVVASRQQIPDAAATRTPGIYRHNGDQGVPGREAFPRDNIEDVPRDGSGRRWPAHNLYVCAADSAELRRHLIFRDLLRSGAAAAGAYAIHKQRLAALHRHDRDRYCAAKTDFIEAAIREEFAALAAKKE